jgi:hypothetical protein
VLLLLLCHGDGVLLLPFPLLLPMLLLMLLE